MVGRRGTPGPKGSNAFERACVCLHNIRPYATCPSHTYHCLPLPFFLLLSLRLTSVPSTSSSSSPPRLPSLFFLKVREGRKEKRERSGKGSSSSSTPTLGQMPANSARAVPLAACRPQDRVTLVWLVARIYGRRWKEEQNSEREEKREAYGAANGRPSEGREGRG